MAYLTSAILKNETALYVTPWQPVIANATDFDTWIGTIVTRAAKQVEWRVGTTFYATSSTALEQTILQEAELCVASYYVMLALAALSDTMDSDDAGATPPTAANGDKIRNGAREYKARFEELIGALEVQRSSGKRTPYTRRPRVTTGAAHPASFPPFVNEPVYEAQSEGSLTGERSAE